ncbi:DUF4184 family protein [Streptomyces sp. NPDC008121]|uniref:DUF4184 family protein n=1 Tax=Streptomyces sp. NPDC008121 TaxID=3364809 RepID=UPI0036E06725
MPFTLSHAAAVLPGIRRDGAGRGRLVASALVAGSFAPDMTYFAATAVPEAMEFGDITHGPLGILTADVLIAALLVAVWLMVREPLMALLPAGRRAGVYAFVRGRPWRGRRPVPLAAWFYVSAALGASTHVVWDSFTHIDRWGTRAIPFLGEVVAGFPVYTYTQYGSSALALVLLVWFAVRAVRTPREEFTTPTPIPGVPVLDRRGRWLAAALIGGCVLAGIVHRCLRWYAYWGRVETPLDIIPTACFGGGAGLALGLVVYAAVMRLRAASGPARPAAREPEPVRSPEGTADRGA